MASWLMDCFFPVFLYLPVTWIDLIINFKLKVTFKYQPLNLWNGRKFTSGGPAHLHVNILHSTKCILSICRWFCDDVTRLSRPRLKTWVAEGKQKSQEVPVTGEEAWGGRQGEGAVPGQMQQVFIERNSLSVSLPSLWPNKCSSIMINALSLLIYLYCIWI